MLLIIPPAFGVNFGSNPGRHFAGHLRKAGLSLVHLLDSLQSRSTSRDTPITALSASAAVEEPRLNFRMSEFTGGVLLAQLRNSTLWCAMCGPKPAACTKAYAICPACTPRLQADGASACSHIENKHTLHPAWHSFTSE